MYGIYLQTVNLLTNETILLFTYLTYYENIFMYVSLKFSKTSEIL